MSWLYPTISQVTYWGVGDIDECSILATYWAAKAAGYEGDLPSIAEFRWRAGRPDRPGPTGLTNPQVWAGIQGTSLRNMDVTRLAGGTSWSTFAALMSTGGAASIAVWTGKLSAGYRYGFIGAHRVGVALQNGRWYIADPLARSGSKPLEITEAELRSAALTFGGGTVSGVIFQGKGAMSSAGTKASGRPETLSLVQIPDPRQAFAVRWWYADAMNVASYYRGRRDRRGAPPRV